MAIFKKNIFMALVALGSVFMGTPGLAGHIISTSEESVPKLGKYLKDCSAKLGDKCGVEIFQSLTGNYTPFDNCCNKLVTIGKNYHEAFTKIFISKEPQENPSKISAKSLNVWNDCVGVVAQAPYITSEESVSKLVKYLKHCSTNLGDKCGAEIFQGLTHDYSPSDNCCNKLVLTGKNCHNAFTKFLISKEPQANPSKIYAKSLNVWNDCVGVIAQAPYISSIPILQ